MPQDAYVALRPGWHALIGIPGGGKSHTATARVLALQARGALPPGDAGFLLVTFSRDAARSFRDKGRRVADGTFTNGSVVTLHALAKRLLNGASHTAHDNLACNNVGTLVHELRARLAAGGERAAAIARQLPELRAVFVDEAQDLSPDQYEVVRRLVALAPAAADGTGAWMEMVGDPDQTIYAGLQGADPSFLNGHAAGGGGRVVRLVDNRRSTARIVAFASLLRPSVVAAPADAMVSATGRRGELPTVFRGSVSENVREVVARVRALLARPGVRASDVAVLGFSKRARGGVGLSLVANALAKAGVRINVMYPECGDDADVEAEAPPSRKGRVNLVTVHASKGREWKHVLVVNFNDQIFGFEPDADQHAEYRRAMYVAATRARASLACFVNEGTGHGYGRPVPWALPPPLLADLAAYAREGRWVGAEADVREGGWPLPDPARDLPRAGKGFHALYDGAYARRGGRDEHALLRMMLDEGGLEVRPVAALPAAAAPGWAPREANFYPLFGSAVESLIRFEYGADPFDVAATARWIERTGGHCSLTHSDPAAYLEAVRFREGVDVCTSIWNHHRYVHQKVNEARYRLYENHATSVRDLRAMWPAVREQARELRRVLGPGARFQACVSRAAAGRRRPMYAGVVDAVSADGRTVVEFKFARDDPAFKDMMQLVFYAHADADADPAAPPPERLLLWNLRTGKVVEVRHARAAFERELAALRDRMAWD